MASGKARELKVCRICSRLAFMGEERCTGCGGRNWGPIPEELAYAALPDLVKKARRPTKLAGYRGFDWPPKYIPLRVEELPSLPRRDPDLAAILASMSAIVGIWGVGHIYVGKAITGILLMLTGAIVWSLFVLLIFIGKGLLFWVLGIVAWAAIVYWAYPEDEKDPLRGRGFLLPALAITLAVYVAWSEVEITYIFMALGLTVWAFLTTRAYNLAVEYNESRDRSGKSPW